MRIGMIVNEVNRMMEKQASMNRFRLAAILWFLAGIAFVVAGLIMEPRRLFVSAVGVFFFLLALVFLLRARREPPSAKS
jgi:cell division protein FtsW (lipid II flippase)